MTEDVAVSTSAAMEDPDLKNALLAAFGSEALDWLDDEDVVGEFESAPPSDDATKASEDNPSAHGDTAFRYVVFEVGNRRFGMPLDGIEEIDRCGKVTILPRAPEWLRGITNIRGKILSVTDLRKLLKMEDENPFAREKIIVVRSKRMDIRTALVVDRILGIRNLDVAPNSAKKLSGPEAAYANGVSTSLTDPIVLIEPDLLLGCNDLQSIADS